MCKSVFPPLRVYNSLSLWHSLPTFTSNSIPQWDPHGNVDWYSSGDQTSSLELIFVVVKALALGPIIGALIELVNSWKELHGA